MNRTSGGCRGAVAAARGEPSARRHRAAGAVAAAAAAAPRSGSGGGGRIWGFRVSDASEQAALIYFSICCFWVGACGWMRRAKEEEVVWWCGLRGCVCLSIRRANCVRRGTVCLSETEADAGRVCPFLGLVCVTNRIGPLDVTICRPSSVGCRGLLGHRPPGVFEWHTLTLFRDPTPSHHSH